VVSALVRKGLVVQELSSTDQRQKMLRLTPAGAALWRELPDPIVLILDTAFDGIAASDVEITAHVLRTATAKLQELLSKGTPS